MSRILTLIAWGLVPLLLAGCGSAADWADFLGVEVPEGQVTPPPDPPPSPPDGAGTAMSVDEIATALEVWSLVNEERERAGLPTLAWDAGAAEVAYAHSLDMDARGFFSHTNPDGLAPWDRLTAAGISWSAAGENIARGYGSAAAVMAGWMASDGHRANILHPSFSRLGVGVHEGPDGPWWTQVFLAP